MAIFSLIAKLGLDGSAYESGLKKASSTTDKFRQSVGSQLGGRYLLLPSAPLPKR